MHVSQLITASNHRTAWSASLGFGLKYLPLQSAPLLHTGLPFLLLVKFLMASLEFRTRRRRQAQPSRQLPVVFENSAAIARYAAFHTCDDQAKPLLMPPEQRSQSIAALNAERMASSLIEHGKCESCMLQVKYCVCQRLARLREEMSESGIGERVQFVIWMHLRERRRASNTGKLLEQLLPGSLVLIQDVPADMERFHNIVGASQGRLCVLFPSSDALSASDFLNQTSAAELDTTNAGKTSLGSKPLVAVVLDGTWRQAIRMHKQMEELPCITLTPRGRSEFHWRRQSQEGRISTVEAGALLLEDLQEPTASAVLHKALAELMDALERQCHYDTFANGPPPPEPSANKKAAAKRRLPKRAPGERGILARES